MKKPLILVLIALLLIPFLIGCDSSEITHESTAKAVEVLEIQPTAKKEILHYFGLIEAKTIKNYALKTSGTIKSIPISVGDEFEQGDLLASLDPYEYTLGEQSSRQQLTQAQQQLSMAKEALAFAKDSYEDALQLLEVGSISQKTFDEIKLNYEIKQREYNQAIAAVNQASIGLDLEEKRLDDTNLRADMDGIVVDVLYKKGELVSQGYPVVIGRSQETIVTFGVTSQERSALTLNQSVNVIVNDQHYSGTITTIGVTPDQQTRTYPVEISVNKPLAMGQSATIEIPVDSIQGIWLNISTILNDGVDYVYIVENNRAVRKEITLGPINGSDVLVNGLNPNDQLIIKGQGNLSEGQMVEIKGEVNEKNN
jgi:RND family efflux transporter MFP subunit